MRRYFLILLIVYSLLPVASQVNKTGIPLITNYSAFEYNFAEQNWSIVQDNRGMMYFGNNENGILEFDGLNFRKIPIPSNSSINSLAVDKNGVVFVGASDGFGYLGPNGSGKLAYKSLTNLADSSIHDFFVNRVLIKDNKVYFCVQSILLVYDYHKIKAIKINKEYNHWLSFLVNNKIYLGTRAAGLLEVAGEEVKPVRGGDFFKSKDITVVLRYSGSKIIVGTYSFGVFILDTATGEVKNTLVSREANDFLKNNGLICGQILPGDRIAFGTASSGIIVTDKAGNLFNHINKTNGLQDEWVNALYINPNGDKSSPLWLALSSGISKIEINSPLMLFGEKSGLNGQVIDVVRFNKSLYVCTFQGIFRLEYDAKGNPMFKQFSEPANTQCWSLLKYTFPGTNNEILLVGTQEGVYQIDKNNTVSKISDRLERVGTSITGMSVFYLYPSKINKSVVYIAQGSGLLYMSSVNGHWDKLYNVKGVSGEVRSIVENNDGTVWIGTTYSGIFRIRNAFFNPEVTNFNTKDGFADIKDANPFLDEDSIYVATGRGIYSLDQKSGRFQLSNHFGNSYRDGSKGVYEVFNSKVNTYWLSCNKIEKLTQRNWIEKLVRKTDGTIQLINQPFRRLPNKWIDIIYPDENNAVWFGMSNDLFCYNENVDYDYNSKFNAIIRNINIGNDSSIFSGTFFERPDSFTLKVLLSQQAGEKKEISFKNNSITINFASTSFENEKAIEYSYYLKGFRDSWSNWALETKAVFTNLSEGDYEFKVRARNIYGVESLEANYSFVVLPPWYRSILAYILYVILSAALIWGIVKYNTRRLQLDKIRLEQIVKERTAEILKQKDELEIQRDQIVAQKKDITDSIRYASRIQRAVLPSEKVMKEVLPEHFVLFKPRDIVSGDFYWMTQKDQKIILVAADCTGHGVPGAFMSMLGMSFLNEIVNKGSQTQANNILNELREHVITQLKQTGGSGEGETKDGMDLSLAVIDKKLRTIQFSGANNSMYVVRPLTAEEKLNPVDEKDLPRGALRTDNHELFQVNADKMPIGTSAHNDVPFSVSELPMIPGQTLYILSDGYEDQFGGPMGKKFLSKAMKRFLLSLQDKSMVEQRNLLNKTIEDWKGELDQVDDILVIGLKIQ